MARRTLSSRQEFTIVEDLQGLVILALDILGKDEERELSTDQEGLIFQLDEVLLELSEQIEVQAATSARLALDFISITLRLNSYANDLSLVMKVIDAIGAPPSGEPFAKALRTMCREGDASVGTAGANNKLDVTLTFTEEQLEEALHVAITEYVSDVAQEALV